MNELNLFINEITDEIASKTGLSKLRKLSSAIKDSYRAKASKTVDYEVTGLDSAIAYMIYRLPATAMVIYDVLERIREEAEDFHPKSVLDLGSGPASSVYPLIYQYGTDIEITLLEEQAAMKSAGETFLSEAKNNQTAIGKVKWVQCDFQSFKEKNRYDLVLASYMANELDSDELNKLSDALDKQTNDDGIAVVIVPGVPEFFKKLLFLRSSLLERGFRILAPCTFTGDCEMEGTDDWCHFYKRIQRSKALRYIKEGELPYEDEKYSYLVLSRIKTENENKSNRIIRHPQIKKGLVEVMLCNDTGIKQVKITKSKAPETFKELKSLGWGDKLKIKDNINE